MNERPIRNHSTTNLSSLDEATLSKLDDYSTLHGGVG